MIPLSVETVVKINRYPYHDEFLGLKARIQAIHSKEYLIVILDEPRRGIMAFADFDWVEAVEVVMKHSIGTRVVITNHGEMPELNGKSGYIVTVGHAAYCVRLDGEDSNTACYENEVKVEKKVLKSSMENYGRILLPLLEKDIEAPKMVYYSSTTGSVYMMDKMMDDDRYFTVCIVKQLWSRELNQRDPNAVATETFRLKQPRDMLETIAAFTTFMSQHINGQNYQDLLWED